MEMEPVKQLINDSSSDMLEASNCVIFEKFDTEGSSFEAIEQVAPVSGADLDGYLLELLNVPDMSVHSISQNDHQSLQMGNCDLQVGASKEMNMQGDKLLMGLKSVLDVKNTNTEEIKGIELRSCEAIRREKKGNSENRSRRRREFHKIHTRRSRAKLNEKMELLRRVLPDPPSGLVVKSKAQIIDYAISVVGELLADAANSSNDMRWN